MQPSFYSFFDFHRTLFVGLHDPQRESRNLYLKHSFSMKESVDRGVAHSTYYVTKQPLAYMI